MACLLATGRIRRFSQTTQHGSALKTLNVLIMWLNLVRLYYIKAAQ